MTQFSVMQKLGCTEILQSLNYSDLFALKDTVASKQINAWTTKEAINVILNCSQNAEELLKRRKVVREAILKYLITHDVVTSASADKQQLIDKVLSYWVQEEWKRKAVINQTKHNILVQARNQELEQKTKEKAAKAKLEVLAQEVKMAKRDLDQARQVEDQLKRQMEEQARKQKEERVRQADEQMRRQVKKQMKKQAEEQARSELEEQIKRKVQEQMREQAQDEAKRQLELQMNIHFNVMQSEAPPLTNGDFDCQVIGEEFCQWFFVLLNSQNPSFGRQPEEWGPQHFWEDAILQFAYSVKEHHTEHHQSSVMVSQRLLSLVKDEQLLFNPNIGQNGMRCVTSPHGIVAIAVAGTIHKNIQCLGIFEQLFGLVRTPVGRSNWKIKYVNLQMKALSGQQEIIQPSLSIELPALMAHLNELSVLLK
ncbi:uncharacterized protein C3orf38 homolog [Mustelus asterias]